MRLIDADELMEHAWRDKLDSRELIAEMIENAPTIEIYNKIGHDIMACCRMLEKYTIPISPNATNGDMIKAMFPNIEVTYHNNNIELYNKNSISAEVLYNWWSAPYKAESEDK